MKMHKIGKGLIVAELLLLAATLCLTSINVVGQHLAGRRSNDALAQLDKAMESATLTDIPAYLTNPDTPMPELQLGQQTYVGVVSIPSLNLRLPVMSEWSYPNLKTAPCRYSGSVYTRDMIVMAHNYHSHFGQIKKLHPADAVYFEDVAGNVFAYQVAAIETIEGTAVEDMTAGEWDLTLFTCTVGGKNRVTVRCQRQ